MKNIIRFSLMLFISVVTTVYTVNAQDTLLTVHNHSKLDSLHSDILQQERLIQVFTPPDYKPGSTEKYDVLYVLDGGNWNVALMTHVQTFLENESFTPPTIIVSVMGIDRIHDFTPTHSESQKTSGGADKFLTFIKNELIPYINKNYPSNGDNTLWGHSLGGMFALYAMLNEPTLFKSYIAIDPSIWWDNSYVAKMAVAKLPALTSQNTTLFIAARQESLTGMKTDTINLILKKIAPANLNWKFNVYAEETHSSVRFKGTYDGLKFTYAGLTGDIQFHPMNGIVLKDKPYKIFSFGDTTRMHYTTDGTVPTILSPRVEPQVTVTGPATLTYKSFSNRSKYDKTVTGVFTTEKMPAPLLSARNLQQGGFSYAYYEGTWVKFPDLKSLKPVKKGITDKDFDVDKLPRKNNYALLINGFIEIKEEGYYVFAFDADNGSKLSIGDKTLIEWNGDSNHRTYSCIVPLSKGFYPFRIEYLHQHEDFNLKWSYLTPSTMKTENTSPVPVELQYSRK
jgi:predicted alpha/beta superfamily hydrolase